MLKKKENKKNELINDNFKKKFIYLEHTADLKLKAFGKTKEELFINAAKGVFNHLIEPKKINKKIKKNIKIRANNLERLLFFFIDELLFLLDTEGLLINDIELKIKKIIKGFILEGNIIGDNYKNYVFSGNLKAVTMNEFYITKKNNYWEAQLVIDL